MKKTILAISIAFVLTGAVCFADANSLVPDELGLSPQCALRILKQTHTQCNKDSLAAEGKNREHVCIGSDNQIKSNSDDSAEFELSYTAGDADPYWYDVEITDKSSCRFTFKAEQ